MNFSKHSIHEEPDQEFQQETPEQVQPGRQDPLIPVAWGISFLMHPLPLPSIMFGLVLIFAPELMLASSPELRWQLMGLLALTTFAIPALSVVSMRIFGNISSLSMTRREDRRMPFLFVSIFYMLTTYLFWEKFPLLTFVNLGIASIATSLLVLTVVSLYWKISAHGIASGGVTGFMTGLLLYYRNPELIFPLAVLMLLSGAVLWARLYLNHHKPAEVWAGWFTGFLICFCMLIFLYPMLQ